MILIWLAQDYPVSKGLLAGYHDFPRSALVAEAT